MGLRNRKSLLEERLFFVTTTCKDWIPIFTEEIYFDIIYASFDFYNKKYNASLVGYVIMPNHIHFIIYFTEENKLSVYIRDFKKYTAGEIRRLKDFEKENELINNLRHERREQKFKIWQDRFDDVYLFNRNTLITKLNYIHNNIVKKS